MNMVVLAAQAAAEAYTITFSDVMTGVIGLGITAIGIFLKGWFNGLKKDNETTRKMIQENDSKVNKRIDKLEERTNADIENIKKDVNGIKGEFATTFVLREDFFRSMNSVEDAVRKIDNKMDRLLMSSNERKG